MTQKVERAMAQLGTTDDDENYFLNVDIFDYDETVVAHPYMDQLKAAICDRLVRMQMAAGRVIRVLDVGTGSGQLARCILGLQGIDLSLCDNDPLSKEFCEAHPELKGSPFSSIDVLRDDMGPLLKEGGFDAACVLGVLHHIPPPLRGDFLQRLSRIARVVVVADEGILEYGSEEERRANAAAWYDFVIAEATRRRIHKLAILEARFKASDTAAVRKPNDDYKESPSVVLETAQRCGLRATDIQRIGDWETHRGGMYLLTLESA